jgi:nucleoside-specific outer membrane channel protein Tsx
MAPTTTSDGTDYHVYLEWQPRLSLSKIFKTKVGVGPITDVLIAAEHNRGGNGFMANLIGPGVSLSLPLFALVNLHAYYRNDNFTPATFQITSSWLLPFSTGPLRWSFTGFIDVFRDTSPVHYGADIMTQPELLLDVASLWGGKGGNVQVGTEWYLHRAPEVFGGRAKWHSAPQAMARFVY